MARAAPYDAIVLDVMLPGRDGFSVCRSSASRGVDAGSAADRAGRRRRPRLRPRRRRGRLPRRSRSRSPSCSRACGRSAAARPSSGRSCWRSATCASTRPRGRPGAANASCRSPAKEFALLEAFMRRPGEMLSRVQLLDGLGHGLRASVEPRRRLRPLPAREDRPALRTSLARDGARCRLPAARGRRMSALAPATADARRSPLAMAAVLAAVGFFVYLRVGGALLASVDQSLRAGAARRSTTLAARRPEHDLDFSLVDPDNARGETLGAAARRQRPRPALDAGGTRRRS